MTKIANFEKKFYFSLVLHKLDSENIPKFSVFSEHKTQFEHVVPTDSHESFVVSEDRIISVFFISFLNLILYLK